MSFRDTILSNASFEWLRCVAAFIIYSKWQSAGEGSWCNLTETEAGFICVKVQVPATTAKTHSALTSRELPRVGPSTCLNTHSSGYTWHGAGHCSRLLVNSKCQGHCPGFGVIAEEKPSCDSLFLQWLLSQQGVLKWMFSRTGQKKKFGNQEWVDKAIHSFYLNEANFYLNLKK